MKIYTKTGDEGKTSLWGGKRVDKHDARIDSFGHVDELNAHIGLLIALENIEERKLFLSAVQNNLFVIGALLAADPEKRGLKLPVFTQQEVTRLENEIDEMTKFLSPLTAFILPAGSQLIAYGHIARTVCRRAERAVVSLAQAGPQHALIVMYLNRLSDYLFVFCRKIAQENQIEEVTWLPDKN